MLISKIVIGFSVIFISLNTWSQLRVTTNRVIDSKSFISEGFEFVLKQGDTIKHGKYSIEMFHSIDSSNNDFDKIVSLLNLSYKNGELDGAISSKRLHFKPSHGLQTINDYYLSNPIDGISYELSGVFKSNKPVGEWTVVGKEILNAQVVREFKVISVTFNSKGEYQKDFIYDSDKNSIKISGEFGKDNLLNGNWEYNYSDDINKKINFNFDEGLVRNIYYNNELIFSQTDEIEYYEVQNLDSTFYHYVTLRLKKSDKDVSSKIEGTLDFVRLLKRSMNYLVFKNLELGEFLPEISEIRKPKVKYPIHPFAINEEDRIDELRLHAETMCNKIDSTLKSSLFSIYMVSDSVLTRKHAALTTLKKHTQVIKDFSIMLDINVSKYINREKYASFIRQKLNETPTIARYTFEGTDRSVALDLKKVLDTDDYITDMILYLENIQESHIRILQVLNARLAEVKITSEILELETKLGNTSEEIESKIGLRFMATFENELDQLIQQAFIEFKNKILSVYSSYDEKKKVLQGEEMLDCFSRMDELIEKSTIMKQRRLVIHGAYNKKEMNPVTYTTMDVVLYERLYNAYTQQLLPWAIQELGNNVTYDCDRFERKFNNILTIQQYMIDVLEGNPNKINRKLRAKDSVSDILRKLELQLQ